MDGVFACAADVGHAQFAVCAQGCVAAQNVLNGGAHIADGGLGEIQLAAVDGIGAGGVDAACGHIGNGTFQAVAADADSGIRGVAGKTGIANAVYCGAAGADSRSSFRSAAKRNCPFVVCLGIVTQRNGACRFGNGTGSGSECIICAGPCAVADGYRILVVCPRGVAHRSRTLAQCTAVFTVCQRINGGGLGIVTDGNRTQLGGLRSRADGYGVVFLCIRPMPKRAGADAFCGCDMTVCAGIGCRCFGRAAHSKRVAAAC